MSNDAARGAKQSSEATDPALDRSTAAIRISAAAATPSARSVRALLDALEAMERGNPSEGLRTRQVVRCGKGSLSLGEESLMRKWRFHDAFRPLSFEALERRRLLAAVSACQEDGDVDWRAAWPSSFFLPVTHARGDHPQRRLDDHPEPRQASAPESTSPDATMDGRFNELVSSAQLFGSELIFAA